MLSQCKQRCPFGSIEGIISDRLHAIFAWRSGLFFVDRGRATGGPFQHLWVDFSVGHHRNLFSQLDLAIKAMERRLKDMNDMEFSSKDNEQFGDGRMLHLRWFQHMIDGILSEAAETIESTLRDHSFIIIHEPPCIEG